MASLPKGILRVLTWFDSTADELKALISDNGRMPVSIDEQNVNLDVQSSVYDGSTWVKSPIPWGYTDRWVETISFTSIGDAATSVSTTPVPAGYVYVLEAWYFVHIDTVARTTSIEIIGDSKVVPFYYNAALGSWERIYDKHHLTLKEDDIITATVASLASGKSLYLNVWGTITKVDM